MQPAQNDQVEAITTVGPWRPWQPTKHIFPSVTLCAHRNTCAVQMRRNLCLGWMNDQTSWLTFWISEEVGPPYPTKWGGLLAWSLFILILMRTSWVTPVLVLEPRTFSSKHVSHGCTTSRSPEESTPVLICSALCGVSMHLMDEGNCGESAHKNDSHCWHLAYLFNFRTPYIWQICSTSEHLTFGIFVQLQNTLHLAYLFNFRTPYIW